MSSQARAGQSLPHLASLIYLHDCGGSAQKLKNSLHVTSSKHAIYARAQGVVCLFPEGPYSMPEASLPLGEESSSQIESRLWFEPQQASRHQSYFTCPTDTVATQRQWRQVAVSVKLIQKIVATEFAKVGPGNVYLGGEGTGFIIAVLALLHSKAGRIGGLFGTYPQLPFMNEFQKIMTAGGGEATSSGSSTTPLGQEVIDAADVLLKMRNRDAGMTPSLFRTVVRYTGSRMRIPVADNISTLASYTRIVLAVREEVRRNESDITMLFLKALGFEPNFMVGGSRLPGWNLDRFISFVVEENA